MFQIETATHQGQLTLCLEGELTIYAAQEARLKLNDWLESAEIAGIDLSEITELDTAGVQVLYWLKQEAQHREIHLPFFHHSPPVVEVFDLLGLAERFGDPVLVSDEGGATP